jgi:predicted phosphodiesterase
MPQIAAALLRKESYAEIARKMTDYIGVDVSRNTIAGIARDLKNESLTMNYVYGVEEDNGGLPIFTGHLELTDDVLVVSDIHLPFVDKSWYAKMYALVNYYGLDHIVVAGDLINGDSRHHKRRIAGPTLHSQYKASREFIAMIGEWVTKLTVLPGNHDEWFVVDNDGEIELTDLAANLIPSNMIDRVQFTPYDRLTVANSYGDWVVAHPAAYNNNPLAVLDKLAQKYQSNIMAGHQHRTGKGMDSYNRYILAAIGGIHDSRYFEYTNLKTTTFGEPHQGIGTIIEGEGEVYGDEKYTTWAKYGL